MAISGISSNYVSRKLDVSILHGGNPSSEVASLVLIGFNPDGEKSKRCAGIQKLIQRYSILLLSSPGDQPDFPDFGSGLRVVLQNKSRLDEGQLRHLFAIANSKILDEIVEEQQQDTTRQPDEQLASVEFISGKYELDSLSLRLKLITVAGDSVEFLTPISS
jgi:hypothetical protein